MIRKVLGVIAGFIVGGICVSILHAVGDAMFPLPDGVDRNDMESLSEYMPNMPLGAFIMVWVAHASGAVASAAVCTAIVGQRWFIGAWILGIVYTLAGIAMAAMLPGPLWFEAIDVLLYIPLALASCRLVGSLFGKSENATKAGDAKTEAD